MIQPHHICKEHELWGYIDLHLNPSFQFLVEFLEQYIQSPRLHKGNGITFYYQMKRNTKEKNILMTNKEIVFISFQLLQKVRAKKDYLVQFLRKQKPVRQLNKVDLMITLKKKERNRSPLSQGDCSKVLFQLSSCLRTADAAVVY